jgi:DNA-binding transcriptional ArsR family regulator/catechol 2,3-dioxygenase-like lactoylglutathione lyase family enzyme
MTEQASSVTSAVLSALANDRRRRILRVIAERGGEMTSGEVAELFSTAWSTTTRHLTVLREAGLVSVHKRGRERVYRADPDIGDRALALARADLHPGKELLETMTTPDLTLDSAMLYVRSVPASVAFYQKVGFVLSDEVEGVAMVSAPGGGHLKLHPVPENGTTDSDGVNLYFTVGDVDAHHARACDAGVEFDFPPTTMSWGDRHSYLRDPDGHTISFVQSARPGA